MNCEACGGDGQIEYGAYRGDDSTETRECRLCGGARVAVSASITDPVNTGRSEIVSEAIFKDEQGRLRMVREVRQVIETRKSPQEYADECLEQLRQENEYRQRETVAKAGDSIGRWAAISPVETGRTIWVAGESITNNGSKPWNAEDIAREYANRLNTENERQQAEAETLRSLKLTATCFTQQSDGSLQLCRNMESVDVARDRAVFKPAEDHERITHVKICASQTAGTCVLPLITPRDILMGEVLQILFTEDDMRKIASVFS